MKDNFIIYAKDGRYAGWPANVGAWSWGDELLVGFTEGAYQVGGIHNCEPPFNVMFSRSADGGKHWAIEEPYIDWGGEPDDRQEKIDWDNPNLALRFSGYSDHIVCPTAAGGSYFISHDRGHNWNGPLALNFIEGKDTHCSTRTDYIQELQLIFLSLGYDGSWGADSTFCVRHENHKFVTLSRINGDSTVRAVMPSTVYVDDVLYTALRRRHYKRDQCWIELFSSEDKGITWNSLGNAAETGGTNYNGNPPALGYYGNKFVLAYGNRDKHEMRLRVSGDQCRSWSAPEAFRTDFYSKLSSYGDLGYPRLLKRADGSLLCAYYWATDEHPHQHIAGTILDI